MTVVTLCNSLCVDSGPISAMDSKGHGAFQAITLIACVQSLRPEIRCFVKVVPLRMFYI